MTDAWYVEAAPTPDETLKQSARAYNNSLTKPPGSLGILEDVAVELAMLQGRQAPQIERLAISIFAADHGVVAEGVSAFPQVVTAEMVRNFSRGGAAITVLAKQISAQFEVVNVGTVKPLEPLAGVTDRRVANGTANFCIDAAMTAAQLQAAMAAGRESVQQYQQLDCFIGGEMGIGNTTSATALACAILNVPVAELVGRGTGLDSAGVGRKAQVIERALTLHAPAMNNPLAVLQCLGGLEIAALVGAYIGAAQSSVPVLVDGFICSAAALVAVTINPSIRPWLLYSHQSQEAGHQRLLAGLQARPLLHLGLRLGEGSGAAVAVPLLKMACALHNQMASFESAGVSTS